MSLTVLFFVVIFALLCILALRVYDQRLVTVAFALLIASLPLGEDYKVWAMTIMTVLIVVAFILNKSRQFTWQPIFYLLVAMYFLSFVGLLHTGDFNLANKRIDVSVPMVLFPVLFSMVQLSKRNVVQLLRFFLWIVIAVCVYGLLSYATTVSDFLWKTALLDGKQYFRFFMVLPMTWHPSALSVALLMAIPVSFYLRYHNGKQITLVEMLLAILLPILVSLMVGARIGVAIIPVLLGLGYLFYCKFRPVFKWGLVAMGVVGLCVVLLLLPSDIKTYYTDQIRVDQRAIAISVIKEKPVFGWGTWSQRDLMTCEERIQRLGLEERLEFVHAHFHNQYLDSIVQFGIAGIVVLLWLILWTFWIAIRKKHFLLLSFMAMYVIVFYFDNVLYSMNWVHVLMFWFCFLLANWKHFVDKNQETSCAISRYSGGKNEYTELMKNVLTIMGIEPRPLSFATRSNFAWLHWFENRRSIPSAIKFLEKCKKKGTKIIWNVHNKIPHETKNSENVRSFMRHIAVFSDKIISHSTPTTEVIKELCENDETILKKIVYVPHPHYIGTYGPQKEDRFLDNNKLKLCFFGAVRKYKNVELLISAVTELGFDDVELSIYGRCRPRGYGESLQLLADENKNIKTHFKFIHDRDIPEILASCHLLVLPYNLDSSLNSGATILAFSYGRTVLSSNTGTLEDIEDKSLFFAYSYGNQDEHKEKLKKHISEIREKYKGNYNELLKLGERCKQYVAENNSSEQVAKQLEQVFTKIENEN